MNQYTAWLPIWDKQVYYSNSDKDHLVVWDKDRTESTYIGFVGYGSLTDIQELK